MINGKGKGGCREEVVEAEELADMGISHVENSVVLDQGSICAFRIYSYMLWIRLLQESSSSPPHVTGRLPYIADSVLQSLSYVLQIHLTYNLILAYLHCFPDKTVIKVLLKWY